MSGGEPRRIEAADSFSSAEAIGGEMSAFAPLVGAKQTSISVVDFHALESPPSITRSTGRALGGGGGDDDVSVSSSSTAIAFLNSSSRAAGLMLVAAIRSHRSLAAVSVARLASSIEDSSN